MKNQNKYSIPFQYYL